MRRTETDIQMRFADFDALGHVNNVNIQHYFDLGKTDFYTGILEDGKAGGRHGIITAATNTSYLAQTRPGERIYVETIADKMGNKSMTLLQRLISRDTAELKAESRSVMVAFDFVDQQTIPVPRQWRDAIGE